MGDGPFRPDARRRTMRRCSPPPANLAICGWSSSMPTTESGRASSGCCASATGSSSSVMPASPAEGLDVVLATHPDIVVIDPRLPELDGGMSLIQRVRAAAPRVRILVIGAANLEGTDLQRAADGFVRKTFRPSDLVAAVVAAAIPLVS